jgi:hypothetical protein
MAPYKTSTPFVTDKDVEAAMELADRVEHILEDEENGIVLIALTEIIVGIVGEIQGEKVADAMREYIASTTMSTEELPN